MKKLLVIGVALFVAYRVFGGLIGAGPDLPKDISPVRFVPLAERTGVILFTGTQWCPACQVLDRNVIDTDPWREFTRHEVNFTVHDIPQDPRKRSGAAESAVRRFQVSAFPTMLVVDRQGYPVSKKIGVAGNVEDYKRWIRGSRR